MKVRALALLRRPTVRQTIPDTQVKLERIEYNMDGIPMKQKDIKNLIEFATKLLVARCLPGDIRSLFYPDVNHNFHIVVKPDGRAAVLVADVDYPTQSGVSGAMGLLKDPNNVPNLSREIQRLQDPSEADKFIKLQKEIDEVKMIMVENIDKILERGEKIDDLVAQSEELDTAAKSFYKGSKKMKGCC
ncbi:putative Synaptobrevin like protein [Blattamonas nauphoetae]|uniref:Synaptobrevin like protein n=1 Tax=Blattamonas nauphoetae TaxID=2049346 RepID=A0ABQ9XHX8_9EUKA|nr:putative Synaptobrevin like protein [Blattamonas nauphoetae]